jgi:hypothetical protein
MKKIYTGGGILGVIIIIICYFLFSPITFAKEGKKHFKDYQDNVVKWRHPAFVKGKTSGVENSRACTVYYSYLKYKKVTKPDDMISRAGSNRKDIFNVFTFMDDCLDYLHALNKKISIHWQKEGLETMKAFSRFYYSTFKKSFIPFKGKDVEQQKIIDDNNYGMCAEYYVSLRHHGILRNNVKESLSLKDIHYQMKDFMKSCLKYFKDPKLPLLPS